MTVTTPAEPGQPGAPAGPDELTTSTQRFLATVRDLTDADLRAASRLPGWTRGHVVAHVAQHADALRNLVTWARTGTETPMYPSRAARDAAIEQAAGGSAEQLLAAVAASAARLEEDLAGLPPQALDRQVRTGSGLALRGRDLVGARVRELEVHHVDLGDSYTPAHWSLPFAVRTLDELAPWFREHRTCAVARLAGTATGRTWVLVPAGDETGGGGTGTTVSGQEQALLAWLVGRSDGDGLQHDGDGPLPPAPAWL